MEPLRFGEERRALLQVSQAHLDRSGRSEHMCILRPFDKENIMLTKRILCLYLAVSIVLLPACSQTSRIITEPEGAEVEINNIYIGTSPCNYLSRSGLPDQAYIKISKEGYEP